MYGVPDVTANDDEERNPPAPPPPAELEPPEPPPATTKYSTVLGASDGTTALLAVLAGPVPIALVAVTVNV
jgi:hypothetical protein